jgi:neutral amino acid transport system substrate-binding protein
MRDSMDMLTSARTWSVADGETPAGLRTSRVGLRRAKLACACPDCLARGRGRAWLAVAVLAGSLGCVTAPDRPETANAIRVGTTLPFSGQRAASGVALERALRLAMEVVNEAGGLAGRPFALEVRDSHSADDERGAEATLAMLSEGNLPFFIGPEEPKLAYAIENAIKTYKYQMVNLLPGLTSPRIHDPSADAAWFRLSPSPNYLACALAKQMFADGIRQANVVNDPDDYSGTFATIFGRVFSAMGGTLLPGLQLPASGSSFDDVFATLERFSPDATLLVTSPSIGAEFLQEWAVRGKVGQWYLGPTLNNPALLRNVPAGVLEGLPGISPDLGADAADFDAYFEEATGVPPLAGSHYYFDAVALLALAIAEGLGQTGAIPEPVTFKLHLQSVTAPSSQVISYRDLARGLRLVAAGQGVQYSGAAGNYVLNGDGDSIDNRATLWRISGHSFQKTGSQQCSDAEVYPGY